MNKFRVEEWTIKESELLNEMKDRCLNGGQYIDEKAKEKFKMLVHLEEFGVVYYQLMEVIDTAINFIDQELQYHLSPFDYKQVDEDINTLIGILRGGSNE